jgi:hypothetical protein
MASVVDIDIKGVSMIVDEALFGVAASVASEEGCCFADLNQDSDAVVIQIVWFLRLSSGVEDRRRHRIAFEGNLITIVGLIQRHIMVLNSVEITLICR